MAANSTAVGAAPNGATDAVLKPSDPVPEGSIPVVGLDFDKYAERDITVSELVGNMASMGFQATSVGQAAKVIDGMVSGGFVDRQSHVNLMSQTESLAGPGNRTGNDNLPGLYFQSDLFWTARNLALAGSAQTCLGYSDHCWWR